MYSCVSSMSIRVQDVQKKQEIRTGKKSQPNNNNKNPLKMKLIILSKRKIQVQKIKNKGEEQRGRDSTFLCGTQAFRGVPLQLQQCQKEGAGALQALPNLTLAYHHKYQQEQQYTDRPTCFSLQFAAPWQLEKYTKKVIINSTQIETYSVWKGKIRNNSVSKELPSILRKEEVFCICFLSSKGL